MCAHHPTLPCSSPAPSHKDSLYYIVIDMKRDSLLQLVLVGHEFEQGIESIRQGLGEQPTQCVHRTISPHRKGLDDLKSKFGLDIKV